MSKLHVKGAVLVCVSILVLFGGMELYGVKVVGDSSVLMPTVVMQLLAITVAVAPMMYGLIYLSHHDD